MTGTRTAMEAKLLAMLDDAGRRSLEHDRALAAAERRAEFWIDAFQQALDDIAELLHADDEPTRADLDAMLARWADATDHDRSGGLR